MKKLSAVVCLDTERLPWRRLSHDGPPRHGNRPLPPHFPPEEPKRLFKENLSCCFLRTAWCVHWTPLSVGTFRLLLCNFPTFKKHPEPQTVWKDKQHEWSWSGCIAPCWLVASWTNHKPRPLVSRGTNSKQSKIFLLFYAVLTTLMFLWSVRFSYLMR